MSLRTQVIAVADGGNGLREGLQQQFPLYAGAEALGLTVGHSGMGEKHQQETLLLYHYILGTTLLV